MAYLFEHQGKQFAPDGIVSVGPVEKHNQDEEAKEIEWLKTHPEKLFLYVRTTPGWDWAITTWPGTTVSQWVQFGSKVRSGFGWHTYRRSVNCRIFGVRYVGWFFESSGNYCRLRKAKQQS